MINQFDFCARWGVLPKPRFPTMAIANPPFLNVKTNREPAYAQYETAHLWKRLEGGTFERTAKLAGGVGLEALFTELCLKACEQGGVACVLVPNGLLANTNTQAFRWWLGEYMARVVASIQFPPVMWQVECGLTITTSILILQRDDHPNRVNYSIFMAMLDSCGFDSRGRPLTKNGKPDDDFPEILAAFQAGWEPAESSHAA